MKMSYKRRMEIERGIRRMRRVLAEFQKLDSTDRWYILTRIAHKDDPIAFDNACAEKRLAGVMR